MSECYVGPTLHPDAYARLVREAAMSCFKWDTRHGDALGLCPFPLVLRASVWTQLARTAEALAAEALAAEEELLSSPALQRALGLPAWLLHVLAESPTRRSDRDVRMMRFDFHPCRGGFVVSEGNIDAASGFVEASGVTALMADALPGLRATGDPAAALAGALRERLGAGAVVGLLHLSVFLDDRQVMLYLARRMGEAGLRATLLDPAQLRWRGARPVAQSAATTALDAVFRFLPAQWLSRLPAACEAWRLAAGDGAPVVNPVRAVLSQSKRMPALLDALGTAMPTWRAAVPETRDPSQVDWARDPRWVLKPALAHEGDRVCIHGVSSPEQLRAAARSVARHPGGWAAQRRFDAAPVETPAGPGHPCVGVYVVNGKACGAYGRIAPKALIDGAAQDIVILRDTEP